MVLALYKKLTLLCICFKKVNTQCESSNRITFSRSNEKKKLIKGKHHGNGLIMHELVNEISITNPFFFCLYFELT